MSSGDYCYIILTQKGCIPYNTDVGGRSHLYN